MTDPLEYAADAISPSSPNIRHFAQLAAQRIIALEAPAPLTYDSVTAYARAHPPIIGRTLPVSSQAQLQAAVLAPQPGDYIYAAANFGVVGEFVIDQHPSAPIVINLADAQHVVTFAGTQAGSQLPNVWLHGPINTWIYGGEVVGGGGDGITAYDTANVKWYGMKVHGSAAQGLHVAGITRDVTDCDFEGEIWDTGKDLSQDPHPEPGTGLHDVYVGGSAFNVRRSRFAARMHDQAVGSGMQVNRVDGCTFICKGERLTKAAQSQVAGNLLQWWGVNGQLAATNCTVPYLEGSDLQGRMSEIGAGVEPTAIFAGNTVLHGRGTRVMLNPLVTGSAYRSHSGIVYTDCQP